MDRSKKYVPDPGKPILTPTIRIRFFKQKSVQNKDLLEATFPLILLYQFSFPSLVSCRWFIFFFTKKKCLYDFTIMHLIFFKVWTLYLHQIR